MLHISLTTDAEHIKVRIHPGLIVNIVENILNFDMDEDEGGGPVTCEDIWYSKAEISDFRIAGSEEQVRSNWGCERNQTFNSIKSSLHDTVKS